ncbi:MAG: TolC family protein [Acidobacteriota bacterium]|nr:TolC family protein [Acidobacteriota bacterium]
MERINSPRHRECDRRLNSALVLLLFAMGSTFASSQTATSNLTLTTDAHAGTTQPAGSAPLTVTLQDALQRAQKNSPEYRTVLTEVGIAKEDRVQSRAALLPSVNYNAQFLYTQGNGTPAGRFIANNGVHEYLSQGNAHQVFSLDNIAEYRRTRAAEAVAKARAEIAKRGLVSTVIQAYYGFVIAQRKYANSQRAIGEAQHFFDVSQKLENGGEVAHSDVVKAQLQLEQQKRDLAESELEMNRSHLELAILIFPDFNENFSVVDDLQTPQALPGFTDVQGLAAKNNPQLREAVAALREAGQGVSKAWNGFLPALTLDYFYGIDANRFETSTNDIRNLGYAAQATLQFPIWNWGANVSHLKQAGLKRDLAHLQLSFAQRKLIADLRTFYEVASSARSQLDSLARSAELAEESLRLTTLRYQSGEATVLEVVDAQNTFTLSRNAFSDGQLKYRLSLSGLQTLTGNF